MYPRKEIMRHLWGVDFFGEPRAADVHVQHLRAKIEPDPRNPHYLLTMRAKGTTGPSPLEGNRAALPISRPTLMRQTATASLPTKPTSEAAATAHSKPTGCGLTRRSTP
jgi:hypothetical protein